MHITTDYGQLGAKADEKALTDTKAYLGTESFERLRNTLRDSYLHYLLIGKDPEAADEAIYMSMDLFLGVSGFPVAAMIRKAKHELGLLCYWPNN